MGIAPAPNHIGQERDSRAEDERQPCRADCDLVGLRDHAGIGDNGHVGQLVGGFEGVDDRQHGGGLGLVALERRHRQREPTGIGEQTDRDLRFQAVGSAWGAVPGLLRVVSPGRPPNRTCESPRIRLSTESADGVV